MLQRKGMEVGRLIVRKFLAKDYVAEIPGQGSCSVNSWPNIILHKFLAKDYVQ